MKKFAMIIGAGIGLTAVGALTAFVLEMVETEPGFYNPNAH